MFTLAFLEPGHFHAALTLRERHPQVAERIYVYARPSAELDAFLALVEAFNTREELPTAWQPVVYAGETPLQRLIAEGHADAVVLAGRNDTKMADIAALRAAGLHVLGDKPWVTGPHCLPDLEAATSGDGPLVLDIMTSHHDLPSILLRKLLGEVPVFGALRTDGGPDAPALFLDSIHHLYKQVNGVPLVRPPWYFDVTVQGDGIVDVPTHLVDLVQWLLADPDDEPYQYERDVVLEEASRWTTAVPPERFTQVTRAEAFPDSLQRWVHGGMLHLPCNGEIRYRLRGVPVHVRSVWNLAGPDDGGDAKAIVMRGSRAEVRVTNDAGTGFSPQVTVHPMLGAGEDAKTTEALREAVARWQTDLPGLTVTDQDDGGLLLVVPWTLRSTHEEHFAMVLDEFLGYLEAGQWPAQIAPDLRCKYTLLATASGQAVDSPPEAI